MAEPRKAAVQIGQLNLRVPGNSAEAGHRIARGVAEGLAREVPAGMRKQLGALDVRVRAPAGATEAEMNDAVVEAILRLLRK
jgi:hypothetical protein